MTPRAPFAERGGALRGLVDLATGCYPSFVFGGSLGGVLPVFHFHDVTREWLQARLQDLVRTGYRTVPCYGRSRSVMHATSPRPPAGPRTSDDGPAIASAAGQ